MPGKGKGPPFRPPGPPLKQPGPPPWKPHASGLRWLITDYAHDWDGPELYIGCKTDIPVHLWLRWTDKEEHIHLRTEVDRGLAKLADPYYCFVQFWEVEQNEAGDTLYHTFDFPGWYTCQHRWWYFRGTEDDVESPSTSAIFTAHYEDLEDAVSLKHTQLIDKDPGGVIDHGDASITPAKLVAPFTFLSFPLTPSAAPTLNYQVSNKKYVDDAVAAAGVMDSLHSFAALLPQYARMVIPYKLAYPCYGHLMPIFPDLLLAAKGNNTTAFAFVNLNDTYPMARAAAPASLTHGFTVGLWINRYAYTYRGTADPDAFYKYDIRDDSWILAANLTPGYGFSSPDALVFNPVNNKIYAVGCLVGGLQVGMVEYDCGGNSWTPLTSSPNPMSPYDGACLVGDYIYIARHGSAPANAGFARYKISTDAWEILTDYGANTGNLRAVLLADKDNSDYIYLLTGPAAAPWQVNVLRYSITGNDWTYLGYIIEGPVHPKGIGYYSDPYPHLLALSYGTNIMHMFKL